MDMMASELPTNALTVKATIFIAPFKHMNLIIGIHVKLDEDDVEGDHYETVYSNKHE
jgi:hypothetical protein